jgi:hypothetical protein
MMGYVSHGIVCCIKKHESMLSHLVYISARKSNCTQQEIDKILASCEKNNSSIDITGVLLYSENQFIQYIEGDYKILISLYDKIKTDNRHRNPVLISSAPIHNRCFPNWQMGSKKIDTRDVDFQTAITEADRQIFQSILRGESQSGNRAVAVIQRFFTK